MAFWPVDFISSILSGQHPQAPGNIPMTLGIGGTPDPAALALAQGSGGLDAGIGGRGGGSAMAGRGGGAPLSVAPSQATMSAQPGEPDHHVRDRWLSLFSGLLGGRGLDDFAGTLQRQGNERRATAAGADLTAAINAAMNPAPTVTDQSAMALLPGDPIPGSSTPNRPNVQAALDAIEAAHNKGLNTDLYASDLGIRAADKRQRDYVDSLPADQRQLAEFAPDEYAKEQLQEQKKQVVQLGDGTAAIVQGGKVLSTIGRNKKSIHPLPYLSANGTIMTIDNDSGEVVDTGQKGTPGHPTNFQLIQQAWLAEHPGDTAGALRAGMDPKRHPVSDAALLNQAERAQASEDISVGYYATDTAEGAAHHQAGVQQKFNALKAAREADGPPEGAPGPASPAPGGGQGQQGSMTNPYRPANAAEASKLPPGAYFISPVGIKRRPAR